MLLVIAYSRAARRDLRNVCRAHEETAVGRFGRAALFAETEFAGFHALRLQEKHGETIHIERTRPFNEFAALSEEVREAATAYENRETPALPYAAFAAGTDHPDPDAMKDRDLE